MQDSYAGAKQLVATAVAKVHCPTHRGLGVEVSDHKAELVVLVLEVRQLAVHVALQLAERLPFAHELRRRQGRVFDLLDGAACMCVRASVRVCCVYASGGVVVRECCGGECLGVFVLCRVCAPSLVCE